MTLTISDCYNEWKILFLKYPEPWKDSQHWKKYDFYAWDYGPEVIHTEEARFLPAIWNMIKILIWEWAFTPEMVEYYTQTYSETFCKDNVTTYKENEHHKILKYQLVDKSLIVLHPYSYISPEKYHISPELIFKLNNKANLRDLTLHFPNQKILSLNEIRELRKFPFVIKANSWASWDWVRIIYDIDDLTLALEYFSNEERLMIEDFIDIKNNYNVQLIINEAWKIDILWISIQNTNEKWEYNWNNIYKDIQLPEIAKSIALETCRSAYKMWYNWVCWLDIIESVDGNFYVIDPNFRLNWSTSTLMLKEKIFEETQSNVLKFSSFKSNHSDIKSMLKINSKLWKDALYILSSYRNKISWVISWHWVTFWTSNEDLINRVSLLKSNGFII